MREHRRHAAARGGRVSARAVAPSSCADLRPSSHASFHSNPSTLSSALARASERGRDRLHFRHVLEIPKQTRESRTVHGSSLLLNSFDDLAYLVAVESLVSVERLCHGFDVLPLLVDQLTRLGAEFVEF